MYKPILAACVAVLAFAPLTPASAEIGAKPQKSVQKVDAQTKNFVKNAKIGGMFEVLSSQLALQKTQNSGIRAFAERMVADHTKSGQELEQIAANENVMADEPSSTPDKLDSKHQTWLDKLRAADGEQFDKLYVQIQQGAHDEAVKLFGDYAKKGDNAALKTFAQKTLPTLEDHRKHIDGMSVS